MVMQKENATGGCGGSYAKSPKAAPRLRSAAPLAAARLRQNALHKLRREFQSALVYAVP